MLLLRKVRRRGRERERERREREELRQKRRNFINVILR
jgi:hypothetical protein